MRIALVHRYFWPDTPPYAHILREIAEHLGKHDHEITVLTCQPSYNRSAVGRAAASEDLAPGVEVRRWPVLPDRRFAALKLVNLVLFCVRLLLERRRFADVDVVMAASAPPIVVAKLVSWLARRNGARFVYHKQDVYPDVVVATGILRPGPVASLLRWADSRTERSADRVVVLSEDMAATVVSRGSDAARVVVINNFDPWAIDAAPTEHRRGGARSRGGDTLRVVFAGNLGRFQNLETVIDAIVQLRDDPAVTFDFFGDGVLRPELEQTVAARALTNVRVHGYRPPQEVAEFLRGRADLGIVSLAPGVIRAAYPSRTMSYLRNGCPVLVLVEEDSELATTVVSSGAGVHASPTDAGAVARVLRRLAHCPEELAGAGARAHALYRAQFSPERQLARWLELFDSVVQTGRVT